MEEIKEKKKAKGSQWQIFISNFTKVDRMVEVVTDGQPLAFFNNLKMGKNEESDTLVLGHKRWVPLTLAVSAKSDVYSREWGLGTRLRD